MKNEKETDKDKERGALVKLPKQVFIENVQKWAYLDSKLKLVNENTKKMRDMKHTITDDICQYMNDNNISENKIEISDGELKIYEKKEYSPPTFGYIEKCLAEIISNKTQVDFIMDYLKEHRETKTTRDIRRYTKSDK